MSRKKPQPPEAVEPGIVMVRIRPQLVDLARKAADDAVMSFAEFVNQALLSKLKELGVWPPKPKE